MAISQVESFLQSSGTPLLHESPGPSPLKKRALPKPTSTLATIVVFEGRLAFFFAGDFAAVFLTGFLAALAADGAGAFFATTFLTAFFAATFLTAFFAAVFFVAFLTVVLVAFFIIFVFCFRSCGCIGF